MAGKLDAITSAMAQMKYDAVGVGPNDARLAADFYKNAAANKLTVVDTSPLADKTAVPYVIKTVGGVKVGIVSFGAFPPDAKVDQFQVRKARFVMFKEIRAKCDVLILLDQSDSASDEWLQRNATRLGSPDILIGGVGRAIASEAQTIGKTHIMPSLLQAKELGVVDVQVTPGEAPIITASRVLIDTKFPEDTEIGKQVDAGMKTLGMPQPLGPAPGYQDKQVVHGAYYSPFLCKACHEKQYTDWAQTKHAKALRTLVDKKSTTPDCLPCHSELYRQTARYGSTENPVGGVECATCHMNVLPHAMERKDVAQHMTVDRKLCVECHTKERSPDYDEKTYLPKVVHAAVEPISTAAAK